jgi:ferric-dicitrate binding protein FerR (iron transport regulator)
MEASHENLLCTLLMWTKTSVRTSRVFERAIAFQAQATHQDRMSYSIRARTPRRRQEGIALLQSLIEAVLCSVAWIEAFVKDINVAIRNQQGKTGESGSPRFECS